MTAVAARTFLGNHFNYAGYLIGWTGIVRTGKGPA
jgi:hypothetical protein